MIQIKITQKQQIRARGGVFGLQYPPHQYTKQNNPKTKKQRQVQQRVITNCGNRH